MYNREHPFYREFLEHASDPKVVAILDYFGIRDRQLGTSGSRAGEHRQNECQCDARWIARLT